jgi:hypothetical protein
MLSSLRSNDEFNLGIWVKHHIWFIGITESRHTRASAPCGRGANADVGTLPCGWEVGLIFLSEPNDESFCDCTEGLCALAYHTEPQSLESGKRQHQSQHSGHGGDCGAGQHWHQ